MNDQRARETNEAHSELREIAYFLDYAAARMSAAHMDGWARELHGIGSAIRDASKTIQDNAHADVMDSIASSNEFNGNLLKAALSGCFKAPGDAA